MPRITTISGCRPWLVAVLSAFTFTGCLSQQVRLDGQTDGFSESVGQVHRLEPQLPPPPTTADHAYVRLAGFVKDLESGAIEQPIAAVPPPPVDMWDRLRRRFQLDGYDNQKAVRDHINWFRRHQSYLDRVAERAGPYLHLIVEAVEERGMPAEIALLPVVESAYQPFAYSHGRAAGLWQFVPGTGRRFGLKQTWWYDGRRDVIASTRAALDYLEYLHRHFGGDWLLALASYNSGEGTVQRAVRKNRRYGRPTDFWHLDLPRETRGYVPRLLAISAIVARPETYGVQLVSVPNEPVITQVDVGEQIDLALAAELAELSLEEIYRLNPGFNRWATDPEGPHRLVVPLDKADVFSERLASLPGNQRIQWERHRIRSGENLEIIARRYRTTVDLLKEVNGMRNSMIRAGDSLIIPVARKQLASYRLTAEQRRTRTQNRSRAGSKVEYYVDRGDTLWEIARKYGVGVRQLASWNAMAPTDPLLPGRRLVIWVKGGRKVSNVPADFSHPQQSALRRRIGYTVRSGDSLARISQRFRVSIRDLKRWNKLDGQKYLQPGQHLTLYVDVTRQSGKI